MAYRNKTIVRLRKMGNYRGPKLYTPREKYRNCIWEFKLGDPDDHPSVPHAHSLEKRYRLNAWTGEIYPAGNDRKTVIDNLSRKELTRLHTDKGFIKYAIKQIKWYREKYN